MRIKPILLALILGSSTAAVAQPHQPYNWRDHNGIRDNRIVSQWVTLSPGVPNTQNRHFIVVQPGAGRFAKLRLSIDSGRVMVRQVVVNYADGTTQKVRFDRVMRRGQVTELDLSGGFREINRVIVYTDPSRGYRIGTFSLTGARASIRPQYGYGWDRRDRDDSDRDYNHDHDYDRDYDRR